ncbi:aconitate hydratase [Nowakowskiella sp. JEL0407]|nr:aconitate hydratase [Nowakowskiella sp. JEL0407]
MKSLRFLQNNLSFGPRSVIPRNNSLLKFSPNYLQLSLTRNNLQHSHFHSQKLIYPTEQIQSTKSLSSKTSYSTSAKKDLTPSINIKIISEESLFDSNTEDSAEQPAKDFDRVDVDVVRPLENWSPEMKSALSLLRNQKDFYAIVEIHNRPYFVHVNDLIMTMRINQLSLGNILELDRVREIGSTDFILKGSPYIHPDIFQVKAIVTEHPVSSDIVRVKHMRRGRDRVSTNQNHYTALRITDISIKSDKK